MSKRYIDADDLIGRMHFTQFADGEDRSLVYALIDMQPTADVVEVVRCKDCKHREEYECNNITLGGTKCGVTDDWFCADGERKETENEKT